MSLFRYPNFAALGLALLALTLGGCSKSDDSRTPEKVVEMGSPTAVGKLTYTIIDQRWAESLPGATGARLPQHRFLIIGLSVTNGGSDNAGVPLLSLVGSDGKEYQELSEGDGLAGWMGYIRIVEPVQTEHGKILFDVPPGAYKLRISSGGEPENEVTALVNIPFNVETPASVGSEGVSPTNP